MIRLSPNSKTILGSGSGKNISYNITAKYGKPLILDASAFSDDKFIGWYKNGVRIPEEYLDFDDGESIEARFGTFSSINIKHIGNGYGETSVSQERVLLNKSDGRTSYTVEVVDSIPIQLDHRVDENMVEFVGWKDKDGNKLDLENLEIVDGMTIYAEFIIKTLDVTIIHKGAPISSTITQNGIAIGSKSGKDISYVVTPDVDKDLYITHSTSDSTYEFVSITDENGQVYDASIPSSRLRADMRLTITYKLGLVGITIKHVGSSGGYTSASQDGIVVASGNGGQEVSYTFDINPDKQLILHGEPQAQQGDMISKFVGFEYPNGNPVGANDTFSGGEVIYAIFDIDIDHDFEWLFKVYWDERLISDNGMRVDIDTYAMLYGGTLDGEYVFYSSYEEDEEGERRRRVSLDANNSVELDIDNTRSGSHGVSPEVITVLGKPCNRVSIRLEVYSGEQHMSQSGLEDVRVEVFKQGERFVEHTKDYLIPSNVFARYKGAYYVCDVNLDTNTLIDVEQELNRVTD